MLCKRIIPCLDVDKGRVVKGTNFVDIKDAGDPIELAHKYYQEGADEICFLDITASSEARKATYEVIEATAKKIFIPLTVGGGVSSVDDAARLLQAGADKVAVNSSAIKNPDLISQIANSFGSQCAVVAIDVKKNPDNSWQVYVKGGREATGIDAIEWIKRAYDLGAGEILLTSMDRDGTKTGYDLEINSLAAKLVPIPIIASGGAGSLQDIVDAFKVGVDAALLASLLHYQITSIKEIKDAMRANLIETR
ncbi:MAG: imidazole glycerol phosphate synthase subunit HisF [Candidatus Caenarcaniphilales bacterium]|jgi:cyclase|nr:imidazole glycerol phosphate synthase subunit HisF [Candidatus Caenarcaniphilales bacterium]